MTRTKKPRLGRGLASLMSTPVTVLPPPPDASSAGPALAGPAPQHQPDAAPPSGGGLTWLDVSTIRPNPHQPRQHFDPQSTQRLADSIRQDGLMQPIVVRAAVGKESPGMAIPGLSTSDANATTYELVAGERRWRAAKLAGLDRIPAIVRDLSDRQLAEWALIENLQREDLNPIERAEAFRGLIDRYHLRHEDVAQRVGVDRATISNSLRLLDLQQNIQDMIRAGTLSAGHAKALLGLSDSVAQLALARKVLAGGWSVRQVEQAVRRMTSEPSSTDRTSTASRSPHLGDLEKQIAEQLHTKVHIRSARKKGAGSITIEFYDLDQFDTLLARLDVKIE